MNEMEWMKDSHFLIYARRNMHFTPKEKNKKNVGGIADIIKGKWLLKQTVFLNQVTLRKRLCQWNASISYISLILKSSKTLTRQLQESRLTYYKFQILMGNLMI